MLSDGYLPRVDVYSIVMPSDRLFFGRVSLVSIYKTTHVTS